MGSRSADVGRLALFGVVSFGLAGATALVLHGTGGLADSRVLVPGTPITVALVLLPTAYMFSPAVAHVVTRAVTRQGWSGLALRPHWSYGRWRAWLVALLAPPLLTVAGGALTFVVLPQLFDPSLSVVREQLATAERQAGAPVPLSPSLLLAIQLLAALTVAPLVNTVVAFGEEFGWRGYLQPMLLRLTGPRRALLLVGLVWGCWHWPLILLGYEYGEGYWGAPWSGLLLFCWFTMAVGTLLGWLALRGQSVWPAALAHGSLNASAGVPLLLAVEDPPLLIGPLPMGVLGALPWVLAAVWILTRGGVTRLHRGVP